MVEVVWVEETILADAHWSIKVGMRGLNVSHTELLELRTKVQEAVVKGKPR